MPQPFSIMYDLVIPYLPGADTPIIDASIRKAVREFLKRTTLQRETFQFTAVPGTARYQLNATTGQVSSVLAVYRDDDAYPLPVATEEDRRRHVTGSIARPGWWSPLPTQIEVWPTPVAGNVFTVEAAITLPQDATELPDGLYESYGETIAMGVLAVMYSMPGKPWTSNNAAQTAGRGFSAEIKTLRGRLRDGGQPNHSTFTAVAKFGK